MTHKDQISKVTCFVIIIIIFETSSLVFNQRINAATGINQQVNFQGKLVDASGLNVADNTYTVVFTIYDRASAGTALWTESDSVTTSAGIFQVALGAVTPFPANFNFNWDGLYLGIKVGADAEMTPRVRLAAVPYAFNAQKVAGLTVQDTAGNASTSAILQIANNKTVAVTNSLTLSGTDATTFTFPSTTGGTVLTTNQSSQTVNSGQTSGTIFSVAAGAPVLSGALTGLTVTLNGTTAQSQTGLSFAVSGTGTLKDINGTSGNWSVTSAGTGSFAALTSAGLLTASNGLTVSSGAITLSGLSVGSIPFIAAGNALSQDNSNFFWDAINKRFGIGVNASLLASVDLRATAGNGTLPVASLSGKTSFASLVVDNSGTGDLLTASSAGLTKFLINNSGSVLFKGDVISASTSAVLSNNGSGAVENALGDEGSLVPNAGFEANVSNSAFADGWVTGTSSASVTRDTVTQQAKGLATAAVTTSVTPNTAAAFYSACMPLALSNGGTYNLNWYYKLAATTKVPTVRTYLDGYTSKVNCQSNTSPTFSAAQGGALSSADTNWHLMSSTSPIPTFGTNLTWGRVHFLVVSNQASTTVNIDGIRLIENANTSGLDYAEEYSANPTDIPQPGDVVSLRATSSGSFVVPASEQLDQTTIGVVSSHPGYVLDDGSVADPKVAVALAGRVPVKVSTLNGPIRVGDYLTASAISGVAVRATRQGQVIGTAMEADSDIDPTKTGKIMLFIKNTYYGGVGVIQNSPIALSLPNELSYKTSTNSAQVTTDFSTDLTTISGDIRIKGNGLVEGMLHIADTLFANNFIVNNVSEFFGNVIFHSDVSFTRSPIFASDTAGFAAIREGQDRVDIIFDKAYGEIPVITAAIALDTVVPTPEESNESRQKAYQALITNLQFAIINRSKKGFSILMNRSVNEDVAFSWNAFAVQGAKTFRSN